MKKDDVTWAIFIFARDKMIQRGSEEDFQLLFLS